MTQIRRWAVWRRIQYGLGFLVSMSGLVAAVFWLFLFTPASCFDGIQNGKESGVDCGGGCVRICSADVEPPKTVWVDSFEIADLQYNAVAYVENVNQIASTAELKYTFQFLHNGQVIAERSGTTVLPPRSVYPIFEGRVFTSQVVTETKLILEPVEVWQPATLGREQFKSNNVTLTSADKRPRLNVTIENLELTEAKDVEVVATLFNESGEAVTASQTYISSIAQRSKEDIVFTWPNPITRTVRSCVIPTDVVVGIDLSGSMNNDGGDPPQPISDTLIAATKFVRELKENDQAAIVTFASEAKINSALVDSHTLTAEVVEKLVIDPADEAGFTNTTAALQLALEELNSPRHNEDARRVLVLLTDGLPTGQGAADEVIAEAIATAKKLTDSGVEVYAVGLGQGVNFDFIKNIASSETSAFIAPTTEDLEAIYSKITSSLCESGATRIDVIAKTPTNFAPLR